MTDAARLADILERIDRIERATGEGREAFLSSEVVQDAVIRNLEVIGEAAKRVSSKARVKMPEVPWKQMAGFRDLALHQYGHVLSEQVWLIVAEELGHIKKAISRHPTRPDD